MSGIDIKGEKYGHLEVLEATEKRAHTSVIWICRCDCGNICEVASTSLRKGYVISCGCIKKERSKREYKRQYEDLTGRRFGRLVAFEVTEKRAGTSVIWKCRCDCGSIREIPALYLKCGDVKSCGCLKSDVVTERNKIYLKDLTGQRFGRLKVLEDTGIRENNSIIWKCQCDCGEVCEVLAKKLMRGITESCGCLYEEMLVANEQNSFEQSQQMQFTAKTAYEQEICNKFESGMTYQQISDELGMDLQFIRETLLKALKNNHENICPLCGKLKGRTTIGCSQACSNVIRRHQKFCVICKKVFYSPQSEATKTCSKKCSEELRYINTFGDIEALQKRVENMRQGVASSPICQPDENNHAAKNWSIQSPEGVIYDIRNLRHFIRGNLELFDGTLNQAYKGIRRIKSSMQGKLKKPIYEWKGWNLLDYDE